MVEMWIDISEANKCPVSDAHHLFVLLLGPGQVPRSPSWMEFAWNRAGHQAAIYPWMLLLLLPLLRMPDNGNCVTVRSMGVDMGIWARTRAVFGWARTWYCAWARAWDGGKPKPGHTLKPSVCVSVSVSENRERHGAWESELARRDCV